jgi:hypothetical protein
MAFTVGNEKKDIFSRLKNMAPARRLDTFKTAQTQGGTSPFSMLTPTEFAELFPKYYMKGMPDVKGFYDALSNKKQLSKEGKTYGPHGEAGTASVGSNEKVTNVVRAKEIYDYMRSKGVDHVHAVGIINNMKYESTFNSGAIGDHGTSGGLFQHHASRFNAMKEYVGEGWQTNWKKQVDFALTEGEMKTYLGKNYANAKDASVGFTTHFEKPADTAGTAAYRANTADGYSSAMEGKGGEPSGGLTAGNSFDVTGRGFVVPKDRGLYNSNNEEQCATLAKGMNPNIGRSSSWSVVPGEIKPGMTVATMRYNLPGGDRTGAGYHSGVAMTSPDGNGNFLLLEQFSGQQPRVRKVNANSYDGGSMGGTTQFGVISSNGKVHNEQSAEALKFGAGLASEEDRKAIMGNHDAIVKGGTTGSETSGGSVSVNANTENPAGTPGPQTNLQQQEQVKSIQTATIGDMMRFAGDMAGFFARGEGLGGRGSHRHKAAHHAHAHAAAAPDSYMPDVVSSGLSKGSKLIDYAGNLASKAIGVTQEQFNAMREAIASIESRGGQYSLRGGSSNRFSGAYQMGGTEIKEAAKKLGEEAPVTKIKKKIVGNEQFLNDPKMQERYFEAHKLIQHERLMKNKHYAAMDPTERLKVLGIAHNAGAGAASKYLKTGSVSSDAFGTHPEKYAGRIGKQLGGLKSANAEPASTAKPTAVATEAPTAKPTPAPKERSFMEKLQALSPLSSSTLAKPVERPAAPAPAPAKSDMPDLEPGVHFAPELDKNTMTPEPAAKTDKQSFNMQQGPIDRPQKQVTIDKFLERSNPQFPTPSLERAMQNISNTSGARGGRFETNLA